MDEEVTKVKDLPDILRAQCKESLFFVASAILGYGQLTPHLHYEMCQVAQNINTYHRLCSVVPRDHYKTSIFTISYGVWRGICNPNETGLIVANNATNAERMVSKIRAAFESAPLLRQLYPELLPEKSKRWNKEEACLPRTMQWPEATWTAAGWSTKVTSGHFDYIVYDDLVDEDSYESPEQMRKLCERFEQREGLLRPPIPERDITVVGNHWSNIDVISYIEERHPEYYIYYRQAIEGGKPIFPEMYTLDWMLRKQQADPYTFATQWMNNPADEKLAELKRAWLQYYKRIPEGVELADGERIPFGQMNIYAAVDVSHSTAERAAQKMGSRNAIIVAGIDHKGRRFLLEEWAMRCDPLTVVKEMLAVWLRWRQHGLIRIGVESFGYQAALAPLATEIWKNETYKPVIVELPRDTTRSKDTRARAGCQFFRNATAFIHKSHVCFVEEYTAFPSSKTKDVLDAFAWCMQMCEPMDQQVSTRFDEIMEDSRYYRSLLTGANI
jgi:hypothetical protein